MKRYRFVFLFFTIAAAACSENEPQDSIDREVHITAACEATTRSELDGVRLLWSGGDAIGLFATGTANARFSNLSTTASATAIFSGTLSAAADEVVAYYPYRAQTTFEEQQLTFELPEEQIFTSNTSFGAGVNPSVAQGRINDGLQFRNLCGVLKLQLYGNAQIESIEFRPNGRAVSGRALLDLSVPDAELTLTDPNTEQPVRLIRIGQQLSTAAQNYYLVLPVGTYSGFTVAVTDADGHVSEKVSAKSITVHRSVITTVAPFEVSAQQPVAKRDTVWVRGINPPADRWEYIKDNIYDIDYMPAYAGCKWFDVDKQYQTGLAENVIPNFFYGSDDYYLCWAATASNLLHYFLEQNHDLLVQIPGYPNREWRYWQVRGLGGDTDGHISEIMEEFKKYYGDGGGKAPLGFLDFLCGGSKMPGYLKTIFSEDEIYALERTLLYPDLATLSTQIKRLTASGGMFSFSVTTPNGGHAITGWGATFSDTGVLEKIYVTNSDDPAGLRTLNVVADGSRTYFEISKLGKRWSINAIHLYESAESLIRQKIVVSK